MRNGRAARFLVRVCLAGGCTEPEKTLPPNAEPIDSGRARGARIEPTDYQVVEQRWLKRDDLTIIAVPKRGLTRDQLRALARHLAGSAKTPTIDFYASAEAHGACVRNRFRTVRGGEDSADSKACYDGTVFRVDQAQPRVLQWGAAAPLESAR